MHASMTRSHQRTRTHASVMRERIEITINNESDLIILLVCAKDWWFNVAVPALDFQEGLAIERRLVAKLFSCINYLWDLKSRPSHHDRVVVTHALNFSLCSRICSFLEYFFPLFANRSYYRCTNPRCNAKKQVERSTEDPEMLIITYEGLHLHYAYSHFFMRQQQGSSATSLHVPKKPKVQQAEGLENLDERPTKPEASTTQQQQLVIIGEKSPRQRLLDDSLRYSPVVREERMQKEDNSQCPQGLLEDIVPLLVRKPRSSTTSTYDPHSSPQASPPSYSSSHSWPPNSAYRDVDMLSNII